MGIQQRLNYFKGQFLRVRDFQAEQQYHRNSLCLHNQRLHTPGIAAGLEVTQTASRRLTVSPGMAVDGMGRQIVLEAPLEVEAGNDAGVGAPVTPGAGEGSARYLVIYYTEKATDPVNETGVAGETRITESPAVKWVDTKPGDEAQGLILAEVTVGADGGIKSVNLEPRKYAGVNAGELAVKTLTFPDLKEPARLERDATSGGLMVSARFTGFIAGNVGIGTVRPQAKLAVKGGLRLGGDEDPGDGNLRADGSGSFGAGLLVQSADKTIRFMVDAKGNTVIGNPAARSNLEVSGNLNILSGEKSPICFTARYMGYAHEGNKAEICNDITDNNALVLEGNRSKDGKSSRVLVKGRLDVTEQFWVKDSQKFDLAEMTPVRVEDGLEPGEAVVIDSKKGFRVRRSEIPWDTGVYGIVSSLEQAAMIIGGSSDTVNDYPGGDMNWMPIALTGRVKARVSAEAGPIQPGDLLTTSATPGYLMRCNDRVACAGAIAGKALEPLTEGMGEILVKVG